MKKACYLPIIVAIFAGYLIYRMKRNTYLNDCLSNDSEKVQSGIGKNIIPPPEKEPLWKLYLEKFKDPIIIVLLVVFFFSILVAIYEIIYMGKGWSILIEPSGVLTALLLATGVGFIFELKADREFEILNKVKDHRPVKVFRRNTANSTPRLINIKRHDVVVGDIVKLESGDEVPADGYLLDSVSLRVDESNFTGELYANKTTREEEFEQDATQEKKDHINSILDKHFDFYSDEDMTNLVDEENPMEVELEWNTTDKGIEKQVTIYWKWHYEYPFTETEKNEKTDEEKKVLIDQYDVEDTQIGTYLEKMSFHFDFMPQYNKE